MLRYTLNRVLQLIPTILGIYTLVFLLMRVLPGDPAQFLAGAHDDAQTIAALRASLHIDQPVWTQYVGFLSDMLHGNLGNSFITRRPVLDMIGLALPNTAVLAITAMLIAVGIGVPLGIIAATRRNSLWDTISRLIALIGVSIPVFWLGLQLQILFGLQLKLFPVSGLGFDNHLVLPAICASMGMLALIMRMTRSSLLDILNQDYIRTAYSKGLTARRVNVRHALSNAVLPIVTVWGTSVAGLLSGTLLVEVIFSWPGVGRQLVDAITQRDYPMVQGLVLLFALIYTLMNMLIDIAYPLLDPRIRYNG
ncbi:MAG TPA: ABC transporter permease [Phototrophicaceae bacterium]|nr:ABC transporter permease [Phototrophicaceae bacterium]